MDEPLFTALELARKDPEVTPPVSMQQFVKDVPDSVQMSRNLVSKRFLWLVCMVLCPAIQEHVVNSSRYGPERARAWVESTVSKIEHFLFIETGVAEPSPHSSQASPIESLVMDITQTYFQTKDS